MSAPSRPLNLMFAITSMPVGGAETLLASLVRSFDRTRIKPQICCLKEPGILGGQLADEIPVHSNLIRNKFDISVVWRLSSLLRRQAIDAVVTVGAGDKMFWGRLGARLAGVPVILSALHSTGWPDGVGRLNRFLTPLTDGFIGVAKSHGEFLVNCEKFPRSKVFVIRNGIDTNRFVFDGNGRREWREKLGLEESTPIVGIVAALRPEKNHRLFLEAAKETRTRIQNAHFIIAGDGEIRGELETYASELNIRECVHFLGNVQDTPGLLSALDVFGLTSDNEASPVSIVEAMSCQRPVVATDVGSVSELVAENKTGFLTPTNQLAPIADAWCRLLGDRKMSREMGAAGRQFVVAHASLDEMVGGYTRLIERLNALKTGQQIVTNPKPNATSRLANCENHPSAR